MRDPITKTKRVSFALAVTALLLSSCAPLTPPPAPTATATLLPTPTLPSTATATPTPVPTPTVIPGPFEGQPAIPYPSDEVVQGLGITAYQVVGDHYVALSEEGYVVAQAITNEKGEFTGWQRTVPFDAASGLVVPHPQETNPELFDLEKSDAPIPQFVNAMEMAGIEIEPQEVADNLQYKTITGADGKQYVIASFNLDPDPNQQGETLEGPIPLVIWDKERGWKEITTKFLSDLLNFPFGGTIDSRKNQQARYPHLFTAGNLTYDLEWNNIEPSQGKVIFSNPSKYAFADEKFKFAEKNGLETIMIGLFYPVTYPEWLTTGNFTKDQLKEFAIKHIHNIFDYYGEKIDYVNLVTEYFPKAWNIRPDVLRDTIGYDEFITTMALEVQKTAPNVIITINEDHNERIGSADYQNTVKLVKLLKDAGIKNLAVGMEMHIDGANPPTKEEVIQAIKSYGVPVIVTEMDVNIKDVKGPDRLIRQAKIYKDIMEACLESGSVKAFFVFQIGDQYSWLENGGYNGSPDSDATILDDNLNPKPSYYAIIQTFYERLFKLEFRQTISP